MVDRAGSLRRGVLEVGKITGLWGTKGWIKVFSYTDPRDNILSYSPWRLIKNDHVKTVTVAAGQLQGPKVVARLLELPDSESAIAWVGARIEIDRAQLPEPNKGEFYWADLIGLKVVTVQGVDLGVVDHLIETGANDVLVVRGERERLIPFVQQHTVIAVDLAAERITVDWDPDF